MASILTHLSFLSKIRAWLGFVREEEHAPSPAPAEMPERSSEVPDGAIVDAAEQRVDQDFYFWKLRKGRDEARQSIEQLKGAQICNEIEQRVKEGNFRLYEIPTNIARSLELIRQQEFDYGEVESLIERSPYMVGEIMKVANSAMHRGREPVGNMRQAMMRLGQKQLSSMLYLGATRVFSSKKKALEPISEGIVEHSRVVGVIAHYLAPRYNIDAEQAFLAGLLHDMGKLAILSDIAENTEIFAVHRYATEYVLEELLLPLHEYIGGLVALRWKVDPGIALAITNHHDFDFQAEHPSQFHLPALINFSDTIARILGKGRWIDEDVDLFALESAEILGIREVDADIDYLNRIPELVND